MYKKKLVIIILHHGFEATTFLRTKFYDEIKKQFDVIIFTPNYSEEYFISEFNNFYKIKNLNIQDSTKLERILLKIFLRMSYHPLKSNILKLRLKKNKRSFLAYSINVCMNIFLYKMKFLRNFSIKIFFTKINDEDLVSEMHFHEKTFLIIGTNSWSIQAIKLERLVKKNGGVIIHYLIGWDNLFNKTHFFSEPDLLLVWSEIQKKQAISLHNIKNEKVKIVGSILFEEKADISKLFNRDDFYKKYNLDKNKKIIMLGTANNYIYNSNYELIKLICEAILKNKIDVDSQLIIRLHPQSRYKNISTIYSDNQFDNYKDLVNIFPFISFDIPQVMSDKLKFDCTKDDLENLKNIVFHSDLVINVASTISLDAALYNKPIINVAFDIPRKTYFESCERCYEYDHYNLLLQYRGTDIVHTEEELISKINFYLKNPLFKSHERLEMLKSQIGDLEFPPSEMFLDILKK